MRLVPYGRQSIDNHDIKAVVEVLKSDFLTQGPKIGEFESALAEYCEAKYAVAFSSGTAALHGAYFSAGIGPGDEIITSPITFTATANAALYLGARPVFVDIEPETGNINPFLIEKAISRKTRAIVPVHFAGHPANLDPVRKTAQKNGLVVIEDACHALGASYKGRKIGSISDMTVFSFHPVKHITTGEGGAVLTNKKRYYEQLLMFRTHGITKSAFKDKPHGGWYYEMQLLGYNYRLTDIQAALGTSQLGKLERFVSRRREIAGTYNKAFAGNPYFETLQEKPYAGSSYHLYVIRLKEKFKAAKSAIFRKLRESGLGVQVHYMPVYLQPYYRLLGYGKGLCPQAEDFYRSALSIPMFPSLKDKEVKHVVKTILAIFEGFRK